MIGDATTGDANGGTDAPATSCSPCDPVARCGCGDGMACDLSSDGEHVCRPAGAVAELGICASSSSCQPGLTCMHGACRAWCNDDTPCGADECSLEYNTGGVCDDTCDPLSSAGCPAHYGCRLASAAHVFCTPTGSGGQELICLDHTDCRAGYFCVDIVDEEADRCLKQCRGSSDCAGTNASCQLFTTVDGTRYGACL